MFTVNGTQYATLDAARDEADRLENAGIAPEVCLTQPPAPNGKNPGPIFLAGFPSDVGGANTEIWHTLRLWRSLHLDVRVIPTWGASDYGDDYGRWAMRLTEIGCRIVSCPDKSLLPGVPDLPGATVVAFCNTRFCHAADRLRALGCRLVYVPCMCQLSPSELRAGPFDRLVFQSDYQAVQIGNQLAAAGRPSPKAALIRGAFDPAAWSLGPPRAAHYGPSRYLETYGTYHFRSKIGPAVGRISRPHAVKFRADLWDTAFALWRRWPGLTFHVLGWDGDAEAKCGPPPPFARCYPPGSLHAGDLLPQLDVLLQQTDPAGPAENWPRVGLEAMAAGVPIVADDRGGWREMIAHATTGFLPASPDGTLHAVNRLLADQALRHTVAAAARRRLADLADPARIGRQWLHLFASLQSRHANESPEPQERPTLCS